MRDNLHPIFADLLHGIAEAPRVAAKIVRDADGQQPIYAEIDRLREEIKSADGYADAILAKHNAVIAAYDHALKDEKAKIPTYLHAAIEAMR